MRHPSTHPPSFSDFDESKTTRKIVVRIGNRSDTFSLDDLQALPKITVTDYEAIGVKKGPLGKNTWTGASLKDVLLCVDSSLTDISNASKLIFVTSSDGWLAVIKWPELFGSLQRGEALYNIKGCNECHGINGEGTAPQGKLVAPALAGKEWNFDLVHDITRKGKQVHGGINPYREAQLTEMELRAILTWLQNPAARVPLGEDQMDLSESVALLAYLKNGKPMTGRDGLIQLIMEMDQYTSRYSHWVELIEVK
ncbi:c-type cytochrome [candidate division KSB1 bacterium]|nr:c-type cytochrome [candidate division KSB1 bacterium]